MTTSLRTVCTIRSLLLRIAKFFSRPLQNRLYTEVTVRSKFVTLIMNYSKSHQKVSLAFSVHGKKISIEDICSFCVSLLTRIKGVRKVVDSFSKNPRYVSLRSWN